MKLLFRFSDGAHNMQSGHPVARCAVFSPDGKTVICSGAKHLTIWSLPSLNLVKEFVSPTDIDHLEISPDGRYLAGFEVRGKLASIVIWDLRSYAAIKHPPLPNGDDDDVRSLCFAPHGHVLALAFSRGTTENSQYDIRLIDLRRWRTLKILRSHDEMPPIHMAWSSDGRLLAATTFYGDAAVGTLSVWDVRTGHRKYHYDGSIDDDGAFNNIEGLLEFMGDTHRLESGQDWINVGASRIRPRHVVQHSDGFTQRCITAVGSRRAMVLLDHYAGWTRKSPEFVDPYKVWDPFAQHVVAEFHSPYGHEEVIAISPDCRYLLATGIYGTPRVKPEELRLYQLPKRVTQLIRRRS